MYCFVVSHYVKAFYAWVGGCKWRVGVATCQICGLGKVCSCDWDMLVTKRCTFGGFPCIGHIKTLRFV